MNTLHRLWLTAAGLGLLAGFATRAEEMAAPTDPATPAVTTPAAACPTGVCMPGAMKAEMAAPAAEQHPYGMIDTKALAALVRGKVPMIILDARAGKYDDGRRIPGAKALAPDATAEQAAAAIPAKDALVVLYCTNLQCPASAALGKNLAALGYTNLLKYPNGIDGWAEAGMPVETAPK